MSVNGCLRLDVATRPRLKLAPRPHRQLGRTPAEPRDCSGSMQRLHKTDGWKMLKANVTLQPLAGGKCLKIK